MARATSGEDLSGTHLWLIMMKAHRALERLARFSIESFDVGLSDFGVMELLLNKGPQPVNEIGRRIGLTSGSITTAVDRLESGGWVIRQNDPNDRRARVVRLTPRGNARATALFAGHSKTMDAAGATLSPSERATLLRLLKKLGVNAEQQLAAARTGHDHVGTSA